MKIIKYNTKKDEHNIKQIKYRQIPNLISMYLYGGELIRYVEEEGERYSCLEVLFYKNIR